MYYHMKNTIQLLILSRLMIKSHEAMKKQALSYVVNEQVIYITLKL